MASTGISTLDPGVVADVASPAEQAEAKAESVPDEVARLRQASHRVLAALVGIGIAAAVGLVFVLPDHAVAPGSKRLLAVALLGGIVGSAASAARSTCERLALGFELDDGSAWPASGRKGEKMSVRMIPYLLARPLLGGATGLVAYAGVVGGFLIATDKQPTTFSPEGILFFALLAGLFAKTFLLRMDVVFKTLLGEQPASKTTASGARDGTS